MEERMILNTLYNTPAGIKVLSEFIDENRQLFNKRALMSAVKKLKSQGLITQQHGNIALTEKGLTRIFITHRKYHQIKKPTVPIHSRGFYYV